jgi:ribonuclease HI
MRGQVVADFIVDHMAVSEDVIDVVDLQSWKLFFDGPVCSRGQGIGCVLVSPSNEIFELSAKLEFTCMNNQVEYESLLYGLEYLKEMGVTRVEAFGDSMLVVQQVKEESQCLDGILNSYRDQCWDVIRTLDSFHISHVSRENNRKANYLAQQASGYDVLRGVFMVKTKSTVQGTRNNDGESARNHARADQGKKEKGPTSQDNGLGKSVMVKDVVGEGTEANKTVINPDEWVGTRGSGTIDVEPSQLECSDAQRNSHELAVGDVDTEPDWRSSIIEHLTNLGKIKDRKVRSWALKYVLVEGELYM